MNRMYFQSRGTPGAPMMVKGLSNPTEEESVVSDSDESVSLASKKKKAKEKINNSSNSDLSDSNSVDSYDSNESYRSTNID